MKAVEERGEFADREDNPSAVRRPPADQHIPILIMEDYLGESGLQRGHAKAGTKVGHQLLARGTERRQNSRQAQLVVGIPAERAPHAPRRMDRL
jgi:hypothetical protein